MASPPATSAIAEFVAEAKGSDITTAALRKATDLAINVIGITIGGATEPSARLVIDLVKEMGGTPESSLAGGGCRTTAPMAAYANGTAAHTFDMDDTYWPGGHHPSASVLPALLALAEVTGAPGRDVLAAYTIGLEVSCRLSETVGFDHYVRGFHATGTIGTFGAAAGCARLLGLKADAIRNALGIAASLTSGCRQNVGTMTKALHAGNAAKNGLLAVRLAAKGYLADPEALEGDAGFVRASSDHPSWQALIGRLGRPWVVDDPGIIIKSSPCQTTVGVAGHGALRMAQAGGFAAGAVERIEFGTNPFVPLTSYSKVPIPTLPDQARYSVRYGIAVALLDGVLGPEQFVARRIHQPDVQALLLRVTPYVHDELRAVAPEQYSRCHLRITLKSGQVHERWFDSAKGAPDDPLSHAEMRARFFLCAKFGLKPDELARAFDTAARLGELPTVAPLMAFVRGG